MTLPDPERYSLDDAAQRLGKSREYVEELVRTYQFAHIILADKSFSLVDTHYYFDAATCPELASSKERSRKRADGMNEHFSDPTEHPEGFRYNSTIVKVLIPCAELERFEREHGIPDSGQDSRATSDAWKSEHLHLAIEVAKYFYVERKDLERPTIQMIVEEIQRRKPDIEPTTARNIARNINKYPEGGAPRHPRTLS